MEFTASKLSSSQVIIYFISMGTQQVGEYEMKEHTGERGVVTWFRGRRSAPAVLAIGVGLADGLGLESIRFAAGVAGREAEKEAVAEIEVDLGLLCSSPEALFRAEEAAAAVVEGWLLGTYRFHKYKANTPERAGCLIGFAGISSTLLESSIRRAEISARGTILARDLGNEPPNVLYPETLAERVIERFRDAPVEITVMKAEVLAREQMNGLVAVGRGSARPPVMIQVKYCTDSSMPLIALIGKGITFDTGGINIKTSVYLSNMRIDMGGSAAVIGALDIIVNSGLQTNVVAIIAAAENTVDGKAMLPGELIRYANGITVEVGNTDAEGRLVLADALLLAGKLGAEHIVDIATLTGACLSALGTSLAGVWGTDGVPGKLRELGLTNGERVWEMPLVEEYEDWLRSAYADVNNVSNMPYGSAITAALFLHRFVDKSVKWAHIDMAGTAEATVAKGYAAEGATGFGARLLADYVASLTKAQMTK
ncbi:M17 family metallopeptidase [Cohnella sp.]|uniref:leucyl aminopeptidase family protein n=1 Tax=Cohnella sp. TaxID=1883426 RepID=UPI00356A5202